MSNRTRIRRKWFFMWAALSGLVVVVLLLLDAPAPAIVWTAILLGVPTLISVIAFWRSRGRGLQETDGILGGE